MVINSIVFQANVTDEEAFGYYTANSKAFETEETVRARHILVDSLEKAAEAKSKIDSGLPFDEAAMKYSSCPSKERGGDLGSFTRGKMVPEFEKAAFSLPVGVLSDPVKTNFGYHIIIVDEKTPGTTRPYAEVKDMITNGLLRERQTYLYSKFINDLNGKYDVQRF